MRGAVETPATGSIPGAPLPFSRERASVAIAGTVASGVLVVWIMARPPAPTLLTIVTLIVQTVLVLTIATTVRLGDRPELTVTRGVTLFVVGALAAIPGWFFGPNALFTGLVAILLLLSGVLSERAVAWMTYAGLAGGQAVLIALVLVHVVPDDSLMPIVVREQPFADYVVAQIFLQLIYFGAFLGARAFHRRYESLAGQVDEADREAAARGALLTEARAEYMRALRVGRAAGRASTPGPGTSTPIDDGEESTQVDPVDDDSLPPRSAAPADEAATVFLPDGGATQMLADTQRTSSLPPTLELTPTETTLTLPEDDAPALAWTDAYRARMRVQRGAVTFACAVGVGGMLFANFDRRAVIFASVCIAGIAVATWAGSFVALRRGQAEAPYWPWTVTAALAVGPAFAYGIHSGFIALVATLLFLGGLFRAPYRGRRAHRRTRVLAAVCIAYFVVFLGIAVGVVPDVGAIPLRIPAMRWWEPWLNQFFAEAILVASFAAGSVIDRRYEALSGQAYRISRQAARQEALLATTAADLARLAREDGKGIFAGHRVGEYTLGTLRGRGGMGDVYDASDSQGRRVAVKLIRRERAADGATHALFGREIDALALVRSPHVAAVYAAGGIDEGLPYVAMEYIDGPSLAAVLKTRSRLPLWEVRDLVRDAAGGLAAVHAAGLVHRDVKPQNLLLGGNGWKLIDLGVAKMREIVVAKERWVVGTPQYMSPEQALLKEVDARADLYALCLVAYRALTGHPAYASHDRVRLAAADRDAGPPAPSAYVKLPRDVEAVLRIGLAARIDDRFATAEELGAAFVAACEGKLDVAIRKRATFQLVAEPWTTPRRSARAPGSA